ncbi:MAG: cytochrome c3 family protein [Deltaproteobacteria bacterium]|nr:cytochrome c3 family protein [Deltaproteobacteria bacterium]
MIKFYIYILIFVLWPAAAQAHAYTQEECIKCHRKKGGISHLRISVEEFQASIHGRDLTCRDCHSGIDGEEHETVKDSGAVDCGQCHEQENRHGSNAGGEKDRPQCHSCHGKHGIIARNDMVPADYREQLISSCMACHPSECGDSGYVSWFPSLRIRSHKKQDFSMNYDMDNCTGCHQGGAAHGETEPLDSQNCHVCHMNMKGPIMLTGYTHPHADLRKQPVIFAAAFLYQMFILFILWGLVRYILSRFFSKSRKQGS